MRKKYFLLAFICLFILSQTKSFGEEESGKLIVFAGISGCGKSSTAKALAEICHSPCYLEPEQHEWPSFIRVKQPYGEFSHFIVARSIRVHALWTAWDEKIKGNVVIMDSYYDKITGYYLDKPGMEWLMHPEDPYFECAMEVCQLDNQFLPDADCIVLFEVSFDDWMKLLDSRGRDLDNIEGFRESYSRYKSYIADAVEKISKERNIKLVRFEQKFSDPQTQAEELKQILINENVL